MEREVMDRYLVLHLEDYVGHTFTAVIVGVTGAGIFFALDGSGAQGFLHKSRMPGDYFVHDEENHRYYGSRTKRVFQLGDPLTVILDAADARTSATMFSLPETANGKSKREWSTKKTGTDKRDGEKPSTRKPSTHKSGTHKSDTHPSEFKKRDSSGKPGFKKRDTSELNFKEHELKEKPINARGAKKPKSKTWPDKVSSENNKPEKAKTETNKSRKSNTDQDKFKKDPRKDPRKKPLKKTSGKSNAKKQNEKL
jgi:ribonuclease R